MTLSDLGWLGLEGFHVNPGALVKLGSPSSFDPLRSLGYCDFLDLGWLGLEGIDANAGALVELGRLGHEALALVILEPRLLDWVRANTARTGVGIWLRSHFVGIRFRCHQCGHELHVKDFQGGKRSKCPECETKFRIPSESAERSLPLENSQSDDSTANSSLAASSSGAAMGTLAAKSTMANPRSLDGDSQIDSQNDAPQEIDSVASSPFDSPKVQLQAILDAPGATWYVRPPAGGQYGPAPADIFCEWLAEHRVTRDSLVWRDGWPQWLVAEDVFMDYFGPAILQMIAPVIAPSAPSSVPTVQADAPEFVAPTSLSERTLAARKRQRKKNYMIMIGILTAISVGLVIALIVVLMQNV